MLIASLLLASIAVAEDDALDDDETASFTDDGEPLGPADPDTATCSQDTDRSDALVGWDVGSGFADLALPAAGAGNTMTLELRARGRDTLEEWVVSGQGDELLETAWALSLPSSVETAASTTPLILSGRVWLDDGSGTLFGDRSIDWLVVDKRSGALEVTPYPEVDWPQITGSTGSMEDVTDLDFDEASRVKPSLGVGNTVNVTFCVKVPVNYDNVGHVINPNVAGEDYYSTNDPKTARGFLIEAVGPSAPIMETRLSHESLGNLPAGCGVLNLRVEGRYDILLRADIKVRDQTARASRNRNSPTWWGITVRDYLVPPTPTVEHVVHPHEHEAWNVAAVTAWAFHRRAAPGVDDVELITQESGCPSTNTGGGCVQGVKRVHLRGEHRDKFVIVHEVGHAVANLINENKPADHSYAVVGASKCRSTFHAVASKEYTSAAANEGFAHYYAAVAFNSTTGGDCGLDWLVQDFDGNGFKDIEDSFMTFSCDERPYWGFVTYANGWVPTDADHLGDPCDGTKENRGTEYDWLRFFWDLDTDGGLTFGQILELWDRANPHSWRPDDSGSKDFPWERFQDAADDMGIRSTLDTQGSLNGVDRL